MTAHRLMEEYEIGQTDFDRCAELAGVGVREAYEDEQETMLEFAIMLQKLGFGEERIRRSCADLPRFPEEVSLELADCFGDRERRELLEQLQNYLEDWNGTIRDAQEIVICMEFLQAGQTGGIFGPISFWPLVVCAIVALAAAFVLMPLIREFVQRLIESR